MICVAELSAGHLGREIRTARHLLAGELPNRARCIEVDEHPDQLHAVLRIDLKLDHVARFEVSVNPSALFVQVSKVSCDLIPDLLYLWLIPAREAVVR